MKRVFKWDSPLEWLKAGPRLHTLQGVARVEIKALKLDPVRGSIRLEVVWLDSGEAEEHLGHR